MTLAAGVAEQTIEPGLFLLLLDRSERFISDQQQPGDGAVAGFKDFLGCGQPGAGLAQQVPHGMAGILSGAQFGGERSLHQFLCLSGGERIRNGGCGLSVGENRPGKQAEKR